MSEIDAVVTCPHGSTPASCSLCQLAEAGPGTASDPTLRREGPPSERTAAPAARLGRFIIIEAVGQGGMGVVYRGYDPALDRRVALKLLRARAGVGDTGGTARLAREAQAMARLAHPNVVPVYDVGRTEDSLFVAMEFVQGATLQGWLAEKRPWREALSVCVQAGRGLEAAHAAGIIHRDFKPANVLVGEDGRARVTDFGLARSSGDTDRPSTPIAVGAIALETPLTVAGAVMGTPGYMAPEQYLGQESTAATDQYAFCVTLYEALYGQRPFVGGDLQTMARLSQAGEVPSPPRNSKVPAWLFPLVARGLAPNPKHRHASMSALLELLERDPSTRRRRLALTAAALVVTLAAAIGLSVWPTVRASSCHRETEQLAGVWNDGVRARVEQAFLATGQSFAPTALDFVRTRLDGFMTSWAVERHRACDDTLRAQTHTERQLSLRLACLENGRVELQTLASRFEKADVAVMTQAAAAVSRLTTVERCANVDLLEQRASLSDSLRISAETIEQQLAEGRMLVALGRYDDARSTLTAAVSAARALGDPQTLALATLEQGMLEREADRYLAARQALDEALRLAFIARDDATALRAAALLASLVGWRLGEPREGLALANVGRGLVPRVKDRSLEALLEEGEGDALWMNGDVAQARAGYERALAVLLELQGPSGFDVARLQSSIGWLLMDSGQFSNARDWYERSKRSREALFGPDHPTLGITWNELGQLARQLDDRAAAIAALRRAHELKVRTKGEGTMVSARAALNLAEVLIETGALEEAGVLLREAAPVLSQFPTSALSLERVRISFLLSTGDLDGALASARRLQQMDVNGVSARSGIHAMVGMVLAAKGDDLEASREFEAAAKGEGALEKAFAVRVSLEWARVLARLKSPTSRALAEKTLEAALRLEGNSRLKARASLQLAKAHLANGATDQARQAAAQAITFTVEPDMASLKAEAEKFLAEHPLE